MQQTDKSSQQQGNSNLARGLLHGTGFLLVVDVIAFVIGFAFFLIAHGTMMGLLRLAPYWQPAGKAFMRVFNQSDSPNAIVHIPIRGYHTFRFICSLALMASFVGIGIWLLIQNGFCAQNIVCIIASR